MLLAERNDSLVCIQARAFEAKNGGRSVFRNEYAFDLNPTRRAENKGGARGVTTSTFKVVSLKASGAAESSAKPGLAVPDPILRSVNAEINGRLDEATLSIVRFIEGHRAVKIAKLVLEYVLDAESGEPFLLHAADARVVLLDASESITLKKKKKQRSYKNQPRNARERKKLARQIQLAEAREHMAAEPSGALRRVKGAAKKDASSFPSPFKCCGDFCNHDVAALDPISMLTPHERRLFQGDVNEAQLKTQLEISAMQGRGAGGGTGGGTKTATTAAAMGKLEDLGANGGRSKEAWRQIAWRSIQMSRQEARPGAKSAIAGNNSDESGAVVDRFMRGTLSQAAQKTWSRRHGSVAGGASNYYREVNVCQACHVVYSILDSVRKLVREKKERQMRAAFKSTSATAGMETGGLGWTLDDDVAVRPSTSHAIREKRRALLAAMGEVQDDGVGIDTSLATLEASTKTSKKRGGASPRSPGAGGRGSPRSPISPASPGSPRGKGRRAPLDKMRPTRTEASRDVQRQQLRKTDGLGVGAHFPELDAFLRQDDNVEADLEAARRRRRNNRTKTNAARGKRAKTEVLDSVGRARRARLAKNAYCAKILLADGDALTRSKVLAVLEGKRYDVIAVKDGPAALEALKNTIFDAAILQAYDLPKMSGLEVTKLVRRGERLAAARAGMRTGKRIPIIAFTDNTKPSDLKGYMDVGMDGCVSKPTDSKALLQTLKQAAPRHNPFPGRDLNAILGAKKKSSSDGVVEPGGATDTAAAELVMIDAAAAKAQMDPDDIDIKMPDRGAAGVAEKLMAAGGRQRGSADDAVRGTFELDDDTSFPFAVMCMGGIRGIKAGAKREAPVFHLVIVNDIFSTMEEAEIMVRPMIRKYPGLRVLLFNLPGQAFTRWAPGQLLTDVYFVECIERLLCHLDSSKNTIGGTNAFITHNVPFYMVGFGNGAHISLLHSIKHHRPSLRGVVSINGYAHVDSHLAGALYDCMNVFKASPAARPDLPIYFFSRFLFSPGYLQRVTVPLALNVLTAVQNPITKDGRIALARGALSNHDIRAELTNLEAPLIVLHSSQNGLVQPMHVEQLMSIEGRRETQTVFGCIHGRKRTCVIWLDGGHAIAQEKKRSISTFIERLANGYNEKNDVVFDSNAAEKSPRRGGRGGGGGRRGIGRPSDAELMKRKTRDPRYREPTPGQDTLPTPLLTGGTHRTPRHGAKSALRGAGASMTTPTRGGRTGGNGAADHAYTNEEQERFEDHFIDSVLAGVRPVAGGQGGGGAPTPGGRSSLAKQSKGPSFLERPAAGYYERVNERGNAAQNAASAAADNAMKALREADRRAGVDGGDASNAASGAMAAFGGGGGDGSDPNAASRIRGTRTRTMNPIEERRLIFEEELSKNLHKQHEQELDSERLQREARLKARLDRVEEAHRTSVFTLDPDQPAFERRSNHVYNPQQGSRIYPTDDPELKEFMRWRLVRNRQRLSRMENSASVCQRAFRSFLARTLTRKLREDKAARFFQRHWRGYICRAEAETRRQEQWAANMLQRRWRGVTGRRNFEMRVEREDAIGKVQRNFRGKRAKDRVRRIRNNRERAALLVQNQFRARMARDEAWRRRSYRRAAVTLQRMQRGIRGRRRAQRERDRFLFSKAQSQGIEFGRQMLMEHRLHGTRLQSEVALLVQQKASTEEEVEDLLSGIARCKAVVVGLEREMHELSRVEMEMSGSLTQAQRTELREQKMRLDREFGEMLTEITEKQRVLDKHELSLQKLERERELKEGELRDLERKLVVLLEEQQSELHHIKARQEERDELLLSLPQVGSDAKALTNGGGSSGGNGGAMVPGGGGGNGGGGGGGWQGPTPQQREEAAQLIGSTETLMKFGFMSMSLTYFSSLNMIQAIKSVGALDTALAGAAADKQALISGGQVNSAGQFVPGLKPGQSSQREAMDVSSWSVQDVGDWLGSLSLSQYSECFADAAIDGGFLYDLTDEDLANTLNIEHALHRKKIINSIGRLRQAEEKRREKEEMAKYAASQVAGRIPGVPGSTGGGSMGAPGGGGNAGVASAAALLDSGAAAGGAPMASLMDDEELFTLCRHGKVKALEQALDGQDEELFRTENVEIPFLPGFGTQYLDVYKFRSVFHPNKTDGKGNTMLLVAAQNGAQKVCELLVNKGANPNHQNAVGHTAMHYGAFSSPLLARISACIISSLTSSLSFFRLTSSSFFFAAITYGFFDCGSWLADPDGGGADDSLQNMHGLGVYDGLEP